MGELVALAQHAAPPHQKPHPFGLKVPRSPVWPPYQWVVDPVTQKPKRVAGGGFWGDILNAWGKVVNAIWPFLPAEESDVQALAQATLRRFRNLGNIVTEDIRSAYQSNLNYSHAILQYSESVGRAAEAGLKRHHLELGEVERLIAIERKAREAEIEAVRKHVTKQIRLAEAKAVTSAVHISQKWVDKVWGHKVDLTYGWFKHRDTWFRDRVTKWWKVIYKKDIRPIKTQANNQTIQVALIWATINAEIRPALKLVAKAGSWLKWFAHWKRDALLAFGVLKAGEVAEWLEKNYERSTQ